MSHNSIFWINWSNVSTFIVFLHSKICNLIIHLVTLTKCQALQYLEIIWVLEWIYLPSERIYFLQMARGMCNFRSHNPLLRGWVETVLQSLQWLNNFCYFLTLSMQNFRTYHKAWEPLIPILPSGSIRLSKPCLAAQNFSHLYGSQQNPLSKKISSESSLKFWAHRWRFLSSLTLLSLDTTIPY